ncbi:MAG TPA: hypothetical protein PLX60_11255 [Chitinophagales bacterium]|nr:hypothetical protein [Chitinophagales bacterium]
MTEKKDLLITCKEATLLICKNQEKAITLKEKIKLKAHLLVCRVCDLFNIQSNLIHQHYTKMNAENIETYSLKLDATKKEALQHHLDIELEK